MKGATLHQFLTGASAGDAITDQALLIQRWLRDLDFKSEIFARHMHHDMDEGIRPMGGYLRDRNEEWGIYHHSIGSDVPDFLIRQGLRLILIYHNVTPPEFFEVSDPLHAHLARLGMQQLATLQPHTGLALADSRYNEADLKRAGFECTGVQPICLRTERYDVPLNEHLAAKLTRSKPRMLFIGRVVPNKRQEDLVKLLTALRRIHPLTHLYLVGDSWGGGYDRWVEQFADELGVSSGVTLVGKVSQEDMVTYFRMADIYVSMSEHEGFGVPLIESMYLGVPVVAYGAAAVPETMADAGVLFYRKEYERLAELIDLLLTDDALRGRLIERQRVRVQAFLEPQGRRQFIAHLEKAGLH